MLAKSQTYPTVIENTSNCIKVVMTNTTNLHIQVIESEKFKLQQKRVILDNTLLHQRL